MFKTTFSKIASAVAGTAIVGGAVLVGINQKPDQPIQPPVIEQPTAEIVETPEPVVASPKPEPPADKPVASKPQAPASQPEPVVETPSEPVLTPPAPDPSPVPPPPAPQPQPTPVPLPPTPTPQPPPAPACEQNQTGTLVINTNQENYGNEYQSWYSKIITPPGFVYGKFVASDKTYTDVPVGEYRIDADTQEDFVPPSVSPSVGNLSTCGTLEFTIDFSGVKQK